jgi:hypothetical protein
LLGARSAAWALRRRIACGTRVDCEMHVTDLREKLRGKFEAVIGGLLSQAPFE